MSDNPILRPVENAERIGQETASMFLDGNRTRIFPVCTRCSDALELPSSITEATAAHHRTMNDGQEARWESISCPMCAGFEPARVSAASPITQTQRPVEIGAPDGNRTHVSRTASGRSIAVELRECPRVRADFADAVRAMRLCCRFGKVRWASGVIERRHSMPGIEPGPPRLSPRTVRPPYGGG